MGTQWLAREVPTRRLEMPLSFWSHCYTLSLVSSIVSIAVLFFLTLPYFEWKCRARPFYFADFAVGGVCKFPVELLLLPCHQPFRQGVGLETTKTRTQRLYSSTKADDS